MQSTDLCSPCLPLSNTQSEGGERVVLHPHQEALESVLVFLQQENMAIDRLIEKMKNCPVQPQI